MFRTSAVGLVIGQLFIHRDRFLGLAHLAIRLREVLVHLGILFTEFDRILIIFDGQGRLLQLGIGKTETRVNDDLSGALFHHLLIKGCGLAEPLGFEIQIRQPLQGIRIIRFELQDLLILADGLLIPFPFFIDRPQIEMDHRIIGFEFDRFFIILDFLLRLDPLPP